MYDPIDLKCVKCNKLFESLPITLVPCGWVVCSHHLDSDPVKCFICQNEHYLSKASCIPTKNIEIKYLKFKLENSLKSLNKDLENFKLIQEDPRNYIHEFFDNVINKIDLQRETIKKSIDDYFGQMIDEIILEKNECQQNVAENLEIDQVENDLKDLAKELNKENTLLELNRVVQSGSLIVESFKKDLNSAINQLVDHKRYELTPVKSGLDFRDLYGKIDVFGSKQAFLISGSDDKLIKIWDIDKEECVTTLKGHESYILCLKILSSDEIASGSADKTIRIWNIKNGICTRKILAHEKAVGCLELSNRKELISGSWDDTIKVWDLTGNCLKTLKGHKFGVSCLEFTLTNNLISGSFDKNIKIWDLINGKCVRTLKGHAGCVNKLKLMRNGNLLSTSYDKTIKMWDVDQEFCLRTINAHSEGMICMTIMPNGNLVSCSIDKTLKIWDLDTGKCVRTSDFKYSSANFINYISNQRVVTGSHENNLIKIWDLNENKFIKVFEGHVSNVNCVEIFFISK